MKHEKVLVMLENAKKYFSTFGATFKQVGTFQQYYFSFMNLYSTFKYVCETQKSTFQYFHRTKVLFNIENIQTYIQQSALFDVQKSTFN